MIEPDVLEEIENELYEITSDFEDLSDTELVECRNTILKRLNKVNGLLSDSYSCMWKLDDGEEEKGEF